MIFETICFEKVCAFIKQLKHKSFQHGVKLMSTCTALPSSERGLAGGGGGEATPAGAKEGGAGLDDDGSHGSYGRVGSATAVKGNMDTV